MPRLRRKRGLAACLAALFAVVLTLTSILPCQTSFSAGDGAALKALFAHQGMIRRGNRGDLVRNLQEALDSCGYRASADGIFGSGTESALRNFQKDSGLYADGIAGPATLGALSKRYYRENPPESHIVRRGDSLSAIGDMYGVSVDTLLRINKLLDPDLLYAGQVLLIQTPAPEVETPTTEPLPLPPPPPAFPTPNQRICLTFDDGPDLTTTRPILAILRQYGVRATFFLIGDKAVKHPDLVKEIALDGHVIGVHGFDHKVLSGLSAREVHSDLKKAQDAISDVARIEPWLYRPPAGVLDQSQVAAAAKLGMRVVMWTNIGGADLGATSAQDVAARTVSAATDGGIILLHEGLQYTVEALPSLIEALARMGYGFQNPSQTR